MLWAFGASKKGIGEKKDEREKKPLSHPSILLYLLQFVGTRPTMM
jgi:hypothetical protein